jgi:DNA-damage-inducible protein D
MAQDEEQRDLAFIGEGKQLEIRRVWNAEREEWFYSVVDVIAVLLPDSPSPASYWSTLKNRMKAEQGFDETEVQIVQYRLKAKDGKFRLTDTANRQALLRIIQSVPSPMAESIRLWLARVGEERFEEIEHPEAALERVREAYRAKGYDDEWIEARIRGDLIRNELTDEWRLRGAREETGDFAILTNVLSKGTFGLTVANYKVYKLLPPRENLRDHMTPLELALTSLSEATAITLHRDRNSRGFAALERDAADAGATAGEARRVVEERVGRSVVSSENYLHLKKVRGQRARSGKALPGEGPAQPDPSAGRQEHGRQPSLFDEPAGNE